MQTKGSLPHLQEPATYTYPKPDKSNPCLLIYFLKMHF